jgi:uncharacterized protein (TIGR01244 family)
MFRALTPDFSVDGQLRPEDMRQAAEAGFTLVINNRPEGEEPGQPAGASMESAARAAGLDYAAIPVRPGQFPRALVDETRALIAAARGPVLAFCRSGARSTPLWALARASAGEAPQTLISQAAAAGYDVSPMADVLAALAREAA